MNRTLVWISAFLVCIHLFFLQFSCSAIKEKQTMETPQGTAEKIQEVQLLAVRHKSAGVECSGCHGETDPTGMISESQCLQCHGDYKDVAVSYLDPHNAHHTSRDCGVCHHVHKPSEKICQGCHSFNVQAP